MTLFESVCVLLAWKGTKSAYGRHSSDAFSRRTAWWKHPRGTCQACSGGRSTGLDLLTSQRAAVLQIALCHQDPQAPNFHIQAALIPGWTMVLPLATLRLHAGHPVTPNKINTDCTSMENMALRCSGQNTAARLNTTGLCVVCNHRDCI